MLDPTAKRRRRRAPPNARRTLPWLFVVVIGLLPLLGARAAPMTTPLGWGRGGSAHALARDRAQAWANAWDAEVRDVMSTRSLDDFVETLAVIDAGQPLPAEVLDDPEQARTWLRKQTTAALGPKATIDQLELLPQNEPGVAILQARVVMGEDIARLAFAPTGARHTAVVLLTPTAEEVLYARVFEDAVDSLDGLRAPVAPFARSTTRGIALGLWLVVGVVFAIVWTRRSLPRPGARVAGRQVAGLLAGAVIPVIVLARVLLGRASVELALADSSPWAMAFELGSGGLVMAGLVVIATEVWERRLQPVASAPQEGSFAVTGPMSRRRPTESSAGHAALRVRSQLTPPGGTSQWPHVDAEEPNPHAKPTPTGGTRPWPQVEPTGDTDHWPGPAMAAEPAPTPDGSTSQWPEIGPTGDTQVGPPPAVTGDTQVGPPPAVTGSTKVGPPPEPISEDEMQAGPPVREVISGDFEVVDTQVARRPQPAAPQPAAPQPMARPQSGAHDGAAWLDDPGDRSSS
ncbi:MAG: hypothetical protein AAGF11_19700 [Myxococcota bacterium]